MMGLYKTTPPLSGRMTSLWCLANIADSAVIEYGCMGHMAYGRTFLHRMGVAGGKLYSTHIDETDIAMGDISRLSRAIEQVVETEGIRTIFLLPSSVPEVIGTDLPAIARELAPQFPGTHLIALSGNNFDSCGHKGVERTLLQMAKVFPKNTARTEHPSFNIIGATADMFAFAPDAAEIVRLITGAFSAKPLCIMTNNTSVKALEKMPAAHFNLVIRNEGIAAAEVLQQRFGTPYLFMRPYGIDATLAWLKQIETQFALHAQKDFIQQESCLTFQQIQPMQTVLRRFLRAHHHESEMVLVGHANVITGIADYATSTYGFEKVTCYADCHCMETPETALLTDENKMALANLPHGFLMGSGELLRMAQRDRSMQIALPDDLWRHAYEPPLVGFRGAVHLATLWANEMMRLD